MNKKETIYLAGPDVFLPNAKERGKEMVAICRKYGLDALFPIDDEATEADIGCPEVGRRIFYGNVERIRAADIVVANLQNFRGSEIDSGTAFECGLAYGWGKRVYGYKAENLSTVENVVKVFGNKIKRIGNSHIDENG